MEMLIRSRPQNSGIEQSIATRKVEWYITFEASIAGKNASPKMSSERFVRVDNVLRITPLLGGTRL